MYVSYKWSSRQQVCMTGGRSHATSLDHGRVTRHAHAHSHLSLDLTHHGGDHDDQPTSKSIREASHAMSLILYRCLEDPGVYSTDRIGFSAGLPLPLLLSLPSPPPPPPLLLLLLLLKLSRRCHAAIGPPPPLLLGRRDPPPRWASSDCCPLRPAWLQEEKERGTLEGKPDGTGDGDGNDDGDDAGASDDRACERPAALLGSTSNAPAPRPATSDAPGPMARREASPERRAAEMSTATMVL